VQEEKLGEGFSPPDIARFKGSEGIHAGPDRVHAAAALLRTARSPVMMIGRVSRRRGDWDKRIRIAEALNARVLTDSKAAAAFPTSHRLHHGVPQLLPGADSIELLRNADVIFSLNWIDLAGTLKTAGAAETKARIIHVSLDTLNNTGWSMDYMGLAPIDIEIIAEPDAILTPLLAALGTKDDGDGVRSTVVDSDDGVAVKREISRMGNARAALSSDDQTQMLDLGEVADCLGLALGNRKISLIRTPLGWPAATYDFRGPLDYLGYDGGAGIGSGPGMAVGAALALRNSGYLPVAVLGDGDYLMGVTALWTAVRYHIPLLVIVANNQSFYNDEVHQQTVARLRSRPAENKWIGQKLIEPDIDLAAMARAQGAEGFGPVRTRPALEAAFRDALESVASGKVCVVDAVVTAAY
jgi:thiamine pyrophosphate-dependent acetolactate synthase large subunit-like protein